MRTKPLGTTGEQVSALCLGTMYFGSRVDEATSFDILDRYYEAGGRFLDTANIYATWVDGYDEPESEPLVGRWLDERGVYDEMTVATKVGFGYGDVERGLDPETIRQEVDRSRDRLGVDRIDLLYTHVDDPGTPQSAVMETLAALVDEGAVRHLGASNYPAWRLARANQLAADHDWPRFEVVQPRFSYLIPDRDADFDAQLPTTDELIDYCDQADLTVAPYSPTLQGCYGRDDRPIPDGYVRTENRQKMRLVAELADRKNVDGNAVALAWMLGRDQPTVPIVGCSSVAQLDANLAALDVTFTDEQQRRLDTIESYGLDEWDLRGE